MKLKHLLLFGFVLILRSFHIYANNPGIVINEILFNPRGSGYDFVELYNNSDETFDANKMYIAKRTNTGTIGTITLLSKKQRLILPGDYIVLTEDSANLSLNYLVKNSDAILTVGTLPSMANDKGSVLVLNENKEIIDEVDYDESWHFKLIDNPEGISLERIDPNATTKDASNWHSAASSAGYATPTYQNSQYKQIESVAGIFKITPTVFSPDNDGLNDVASIQYTMEQPGYVANVSIFNTSGQLVRHLIKNGIMSTTGYWNWDGLDNKNMALPMGQYIVLNEVFNLQGKTKRFKNVVVLARLRN